MNVIPNGEQKHVSIRIINKLRFIDSFQFLGASLDNLGKDDFKYLSQVFDNNV